MSTLTERQAEVLSYLTGLAPVGNPFRVSDKVQAQDMGHIDRGYFRAIIRKLEGKEVVERVQQGTGATAALLHVLKRPEAYTVREWA